MIDAPVCPACGAALPPDAERCDLCGTELDPASTSVPRALPDALAEATQPRPAAQALGEALGGGGAAVTAPGAEPVRCSACGHVNPPWSRFCNQCAAPVSAVAAAATSPPSPAPEPTSARPDVAPASLVLPAPAAPVVPAAEAARPPSDPGRRALLYVGVGVAAVLLLYFVTQASRRPAPPEPGVGVETGRTPQLAPTPAALPDSLRERVAQLEDEGTAQSLNDAGGLVYRASATLPPEDPQRGALAQQAVGLYERSLDLEDDPDVRVNLAVAALLDPRNPMRAVQELQAVLTADPDHVEANFNMGLMRMQIGRLDAAAESFQKVIEGTEASDPVHQRAAEALAAVEGALAQQPQAGGS